VFCSFVLFEFFSMGIYMTSAKISGFQSQRTQSCSHFDEKKIVRTLKID
jgi:hypothetical protein